MCNDMLDPSDLCASHCEVIHQGFETSVALCWDTKRNKQVIVKTLEKNKYINDEEYTKARKEIEFLKETRHPNILSLLHYNESSSCMSLIFEYAPLGDLQNTIQYKVIPEIEARKFAYQVLDSLKYLHKSGIVHCDLKPKNILLFELKDVKEKENSFLNSAYKNHDHEIVLKICDLGFAERVDEKSKKVKFQGLRGTSGYLAPELLEGKDFDGSVDVWALGVMLYTLLGGYEPYFPTSVCLQRPELDWDERYWGQMTECCKDFIQKLLTVDPKKRLTAEEALKHDWFTIDNRELEMPLVMDMLPGESSLELDRQSPKNDEGDLGRPAASVNSSMTTNSQSSCSNITLKAQKRLEMEKKLLTPSMSASVAKIKFLQMWNPHDRVP